MSGPDAQPLPPGQRERRDFPRFGMTTFAKRRPAVTTGRRLELDGNLLPAPQVLEDAFLGLTRETRTADFHCVTTWSRRGLAWSGVRFEALFRTCVLPMLREPVETASVRVLLRGQDGWRTTLPLDDLLSPDVLVADRLDGEPLSIAHGAPLRLVAPAHYGYKSVKHLARVGFWTGEIPIRPAAPRFFDHPRARVASEERVRWLPGISVRWLGRAFIPSTVATFARQTVE